MKYNNLGRSGLRVSEISFGSWLTFGNSLDRSKVAEFMKTAVDLGVNFFDNAEVYAKGESETLMGECLRDFRREDLVITTKIFWGGNGPNDIGLSWKHLVEGVRNSLRRMRISYLDMVFCHRPDPNTPIEETVRAFDYIIKSGYAFYWGTSEWSSSQLESVFEVAEKYNCIPPIAEQPQYNMFCRKRVEEEYEQLYSKYGLGLTTWSPLASGILTGKYNDLIPAESRLAENDWLQKEITEDRLKRVRALKEVAEDLDCTMAQLAIAWCMKNSRVSSVITGATRLAQLKENLESSSVKEKLNSEIMKRIEGVLS
ncbi:MAG TPA: aldo/keto reductase [Oligoflexia bacterium]|nr:aldo/keto reductase [Oligoflexia bacterium]HMP47276.1 aldo/keto reductase [Oligoflexia bacterium]